MTAKICAIRAKERAPHIKRPQQSAIDTMTANIIATITRYSLLVLRAGECAQEIEMKPLDGQTTISNHVFVFCFKKLRFLCLCFCFLNIPRGENIFDAVLVTMMHASYGAVADSSLPANNRPKTYTACVSCCEFCRGCPDNTPQECLSEFGEKFTSQACRPRTPLL